MNAAQSLAQLSDAAGGLGLSSLVSGELLFLEIAVLVFLILWPLFLSTWMFWRNEEFKRGLKWILLEIKVPREIDKSPKAMEQVLGSIHALRNTANDFGEKYWDGEVTRWYCFEMVSFGGEVHLYMRIYYKQRDLIEAAFFSYYKDVELIEVDDYVDDRFPKAVRELYAQGYDMWGSEMMLARPDAYPIKSYADFEAVGSNIEGDQQFDPISAFLEVLAKAKKEEIVGIQILAAPASPTWHKEWKPLVEELSRTRKKSSTASSVTTKIDFPGGPLPAFEAQGKAKDSGLDDFSKIFNRSPGETDALKAVEKNLSKQAFKSLIRFIYFSPKSIFYDSYARRGLSGAFNQYASLDLNYFVQNYSVSTRTKIWNFPFVFPKWRNEFRKQRLLYMYVRRKRPIETKMGKLLTSYIFNWNIHSRTFNLSVESLATLFHPPTRFVLTAPHMIRAESRKTGPPAGLAIFGEEEKLERFTRE